MNNIQFNGYKVNTRIKYYTSNTVLFSNDTDNITVEMAKEVLNYYLGIISRKNPVLDNYIKAKKVLGFLVQILSNQKPPRCTKKEIEATIDVIEEIQKASAKTEEEKNIIARNALICKLMINAFGG